MEGPADQTNPCAICLGAMRAGGGKAIFTAECSHTFHFTCISASVEHGNLVCPLCNAHWHDLPFVRPKPVPPPPPPPVPTHFQQPHDLPFVLPTTVPPPPVPSHFLQRRNYHIEPVIIDFDDDEQVEPASRIPNSQPEPAAGAAAVYAHTEWWPDAKYLSSDNFDFAVHVHVKAPGMIDTDAAPRAPLDLVTVLDVSARMSGLKLALLQQTMRFVINNLGPDDRLSVVSFSSKARRVTRLAPMTEAGKASCVGAVNFLSAGGDTNIAEGLRTAAKVLDERRQRNAISSVLLLSGGQNTYGYTLVTRRGGYESLVPPSFLRTGGEPSVPIHTLGFGNEDHTAALHVIAEATGGTFSFIESEWAIKYAFAQCVGRQLPVVVQQARIAVACVHPAVRVVSVTSGTYESRVDEDGCAASVRIGELHAHEERVFQLFVAVPTAEELDGNNIALAKVVFSYRDAASGLDVSVTADDPEVERERVRVEAAQDIAAARAAAERGAYQEAVKILQNRLRAGEQMGYYDDTVTVALDAELREMRSRKASAEQRQQQPEGGGQNAHNSEPLQNK